jgi:hypothetical protein
MKEVIYWCRWACLAPAYYVGLYIGPFILTLCLFCFRAFITDHVDIYAYTYIYIFVGCSSSSFGVILACAWVAPKAKKLVAILSGLLCTMTGSIFAASVGEKFPHDLWFIFGGYVLGVGLALLCLFWLLSRQSINPLQPKLGAPP